MKSSANSYKPEYLPKMPQSAQIRNSCGAEQIVSAHYKENSIWPGSKYIIQQNSQKQVEVLVEND